MTPWESKYVQYVTHETIKSHLPQPQSLRRHAQNILLPRPLSRQRRCPQARWVLRQRQQVLQDHAQRRLRNQHCLREGRVWEWFQSRPGRLINAVAGKKFLYHKLQSVFLDHEQKTDVWLSRFGILSPILLLTFFLLYSMIYPPQQPEISTRSCSTRDWFPSPVAQLENSGAIFKCSKRSSGIGRRTVTLTRYVMSLMWRDRMWRRSLSTMKTSSSYCIVIFLYYLIPALDFYIHLLLYT